MQFGSLVDDISCTSIILILLVPRKNAPSVVYYEFNVLLFQSNLNYIFIPMTSQQTLNVNCL